ncbi:MAG: hypothetical protein ACLGHX_07415, partial [Acidimicrobiia bacterium]
EHDAGKLWAYSRQFPTLADVTVRRLVGEAHPNESLALGSAQGVIHRCAAGRQRADQSNAGGEQTGLLDELPARDVIG